MATTKAQDWMDAQSTRPELLTVDGFEIVVAVEDRYTAADFYRLHETTQAVNASDLVQVVVTDTAGTKHAYNVFAFYGAGDRLQSLAQGQVVVGTFWAVDTN